MMRFSVVLGLFAGMSTCLGFSSVALPAEQLFAKQIVCCCLSVLVSIAYYITLTALQCLWSRAKRARSLSQNMNRPSAEPRSQGAPLCGRGGGAPPSDTTRQRSAFVDDMTSTIGTHDQSCIMQQYTVQSPLLRTIDFDHQMREIRLFVSREELWYTQYPVALACFIMFFCVPMCNIACLLALGIGFLTKNVYDERKRGVCWKRESNRSVLFVMIVLCAVLSVCSLCPVVTILNHTSSPLLAPTIVNSTDTLQMGNLSASSRLSMTSIQSRLSRQHRQRRRRWQSSKPAGLKGPQP